MASITKHSSCNILDISFEYLSGNPMGTQQTQRLIYQLVLLVCPNNAIQVISKTPIVRFIISPETQFDVLSALEILNNAQLNNVGRIRCKLRDSSWKSDNLPVLERLTHDSMAEITKRSKLKYGNEFVPNHDAKSPLKSKMLDSVKTKLSPLLSNLRTLPSLNCNLEIQIVSSYLSEHSNASTVPPSLNTPLKSGCTDLNNSKVVLISNLNKFFDSAQQIFNFCSCFGKIRALVYMFNRQIVLVEFVIDEAVESCIENINQRTANEFKFHAARSRKYLMVNRETDITKVKSEKFNEYVFPMEDNSIDKTRSFSNVSQEVLIFCTDNRKQGSELLERNLSFYVGTVEKYGQVETLVKKVRVGQKMVGYVFKMKNLASAVSVVSKLHWKLETNLVWSACFYE